MAFAVGIFLNAAFVVIEVIYGVVSHSLALVADAGHNLSDVLGLVVAWGATVLAKRAATKRHTYGMKRSSILAALLNAIFLLLSVGAIAWEAIKRLWHPTEVAAFTVIWVSAVGIVINAATALMFMSGRKHDLNIRGAFAHMAADAVISAGVVVAGIVVMFTQWYWLDPVVSLILVAVIVYGTWGLLRESVNLAMDAVPENVDADKVARYLKGLQAVKEMHHLHIWGLSTTEAALTAHLVLEKGAVGDALLPEINKELREFRITHVTIQFECAGCEGKECE